MVFLTWKIVKMTLSDGQHLTKILILETIYPSFSQKRQLKVGLARLEIIPNQFLNTPKQLSKRQKNDFHDAGNGQNDPLRGPNDLRF